MSPRNDLAGPDRDFVEALSKGLDVLTCFGRKHSRLTLSEVARLTGASPASARRSLHTMVVRGFLETDGKRFWMTSRSLLIAHAFLASQPMVALAQPLLDRLAEQTRESASLAHLLDDDAIIVARATARRTLSTGLGIGSRLPAHASALGRMLLAGLEPGAMWSRVRAMSLAALTPDTPTSAAQVIAIVDHSRSTGHAECDNELEVGVRSLAVALRHPSGATVAAMSIAVRAERMSMQTFRSELLPQLTNARDRLSRMLFPS
ncbi:IclR family transcriptional regulator domain-containing protein [Piscinibacter koreensis]|uniref:Helix-turn-helix domain-containing protein n=1 Tax=Piscinibacter koreensis TaxID=2742824 RepID=A0A7Y6TY83_9BURK|nr:IclR family transcriptional regulator C-terminal domain-containing protein [Schlegelella koreensis]NUZ07939.1 helix-turn-helix domain-containing protein [Schlegelella koreensis]